MALGKGSLCGLDTESSMQDWHFGLTDEGEGGVAGGIESSIDDIRGIEPIASLTLPVLRITPASMPKLALLFPPVKVPAAALAPMYCGVPTIEMPELVPKRVLTLAVALLLLVMLIAFAVLGFASIRQVAAQTD